MKDKNTFTLKVKDFTLYPGARYRSDGKFSGQEFYEDFLKEKFDQVWKISDKVLLLDLDGTYGYASSFISEVILRLVKDYKDIDKIKSKLKIKSEDEPILKEIIKDRINETNVE
ncbi:MAG: DUF4325 domain-containing protein [Ignavibacteria bacterium]|nr:DUF4325 domain-containing protein [Ignavibacteria bacterium]